MRSFRARPSRFLKFNLTAGRILLGYIGLIVGEGNLGSDNDFKISDSKVDQT